MADSEKYANLPPPYPDGANPSSTPAQNQASYPTQASYPAQTPYPLQAPYPTQTPAQAPYPTQTPYPPQSTPYPAQTPYPPQQNLAPPPPYTAGSYGSTQNIVVMPSSGSSTQHVIVTQPRSEAVLVLRGPVYGPEPVHVECTNCHQQITTRVDYENGACTWLMFGLCCIFGCWLGCCLIPFCMKSTKNAKHMCPNCNVMVGYYNRM